MGGIAALIGAVLGSGGVFSVRALNNPTATPQPTVTVTVTRTIYVASSALATAQASAAPGQAGTGTALGESAPRQGSFRITSSGYNLDTVPPESDSLTPSLNATFNPKGQIELTTGNYGSKIAQWSGPGDPNEQQCGDTANTTNAGTVIVSRGATYCVVTHVGTVAALTVTDIGHDNPYFVAGTYKIWLSRN
jgi:hypothetical protein